MSSPVKWLVHENLENHWKLDCSNFTYSSIYPSRDSPLWGTWGTFLKSGAPKVGHTKNGTDTSSPSSTVRPSKNGTNTSSPSKNAESTKNFHPIQSMLCICCAYNVSKHHHYRLLVTSLHHLQTDWLIVLIKKTILIIKVTHNFYKYQYFHKSGCWCRHQ